MILPQHTAILEQTNWLSRECSSARKTEYLFSLTRSSSLDGVIEVNEQALTGFVEKKSKRLYLIDWQRRKARWILVKCKPEDRGAQRKLFERFVLRDQGYVSHRFVAVLFYHMQACALFMSCFFLKCKYIYIYIKLISIRIQLIIAINWLLFSLFICSRLGSEKVVGFSLFISINGRAPDLRRLNFWTQKDKSTRQAAFVWSWSGLFNEQRLV